MSITLHDRARDLATTALERNIVRRIWERDATVWNEFAGEPLPGTTRAAILNRLGWLEAPSGMRERLSEVREFAERVRADGIDTVYLLGMGGSSLCAEVIRHVAGRRDGWPDVHVLDTTDEGTIVPAAERMEPGRTLFIVSSKSGTTVEVGALEAFFFTRVQQTLGTRAPAQFAAITDRGTALEKLAGRRGYRHTFLNPADIGGRFSALSFFGLVPAALLGVDPESLLEAGEAMAAGCRQENHTNAGLELGAAMAVAAAEGRDKLTFLLPRGLSSLGLWIEQLVAESTGKQSKGILPILDEPRDRDVPYGDDRLFVLYSSDDDDAEYTRSLEDLQASGQPYVRLSARASGLGAEFFRWEFATAIAGALIGVNPFDEPNVQEAKDRTRDLLGEYRIQAALPEPSVLASDDGVRMFASAHFADTDPLVLLRAVVDSARPGDYTALLCYLTPDAVMQAALQDARRLIRRRARVATTVGIGPRYLHSTGQYHKGGPERGVYVIMTADEATFTDVPDAGYSFAVLKQAQALGDYAALRARNRRVLRIHLPATTAPRTERAAVTPGAESHGEMVRALFMHALG